MQSERSEQVLKYVMCQGEELNQEMQNFITLHMLNSNSKKHKPEPNNFVCPRTGSHFDGHDLVQRMELLKHKRSLFDDQLRQENLRQRQLAK